MVPLLGYISYNKTLGLKYYADMNDAPLSDLLRQASIKNKNQLMAFSDSSWQYFPDTGISTGVYIILYQGGKIYHETHVLVIVAKSSAESEYNKSRIAGMDLSYLMMLINALLNKEPYIVPDEAHLIILDSKSAVGMANNSKDINHTRNIYIRVHFVRNGEN